MVQKKAPLITKGAFEVLSGELGIRTPGPVTVNSFQDCRNRPLCQLSGVKSTKPCRIAKLDIDFF